MDQIIKILSNFTSNGLITAFVVVGLVCWGASWISTHLLRGKIHSSAIAIVAGLLLAWVGGELTGGKKGIADISLFSGIALMGGGMFRDFAIIATAFGVKLEELKKAGLAGLLALIISTVLSFYLGAIVAWCSGSQKARTRSKKDATPCCVASYVNYWPECSDLGYG